MITEHYTPLITPADVGRLARPCDMDAETVARAIEESTLQDIRPKLGGELFLRLTEGVRYGLLLDGGSYVTGCGQRRVFGGLRRALAYYTWARLVRDGEARLTRFGYVAKSDDYSDRADFKERLQAYNGAFSLADGYMKECLVYIQDNPDIFPDYHGRGRFRSDRTRTKIIGD